VATTIIAGINLLFIAIAATDPGDATTPVARASWPAVLMLLAVDPLYEETFEVAYNVRATETNGVAFGVTLSAVIRLVKERDESIHARLALNRNGGGGRSRSWPTPSMRRCRTS